MFLAIRHARKIPGTPMRHAGFLQYGDAAGHEKRLQALRVAPGKQG